MKTIQVSLTTDPSNPRKIARLFAGNPAFTSMSATVSNKTLGAKIVERMNKAAPSGTKYELASEDGNTFKIRVQRTVALLSKSAELARDAASKVYEKRYIGAEHEFSEDDPLVLTLTVNVNSMKIVKG